MHLEHLLLMPCTQATTPEDAMPYSQQHAIEAVAQKFKWTLDTNHRWTLDMVRHDIDVLAVNQTGCFQKSTVLSHQGTFCV